MMYIDKKGDINMMEKIPSICIINNTCETPPRFSFIIPTYKRSDLLEYAIKSCLKQDLGEPFEILIVDDNPERNDETELLIKDKFDIPGIIYFKNTQNVRQEGNWNKLFLLARTEWMIMLHDDDMLYPDYGNYLKIAMKHYKDADAFFPAFVEHTSENDNLPERKQKKIIARIIKESDFLQGCILGAPVGMCVKRNLTLNIGGVNSETGVALDYDFYVRFSRIGKIVKLYGYPLGVWRKLRNVSQKPSTVIECVRCGDILKKETLEDLNRYWLWPIYKHYIKGFDHQHIISWSISMNNGELERRLLPKITILDKLIFKSFKLLFAIRRRLRSNSFNININNHQ